MSPWSDSTIELLFGVTKLLAREADTGDTPPVRLELVAPDTLLLPPSPPLADAAEF